MTEILQIRRCPLISLLYSITVEQFEGMYADDVIDFVKAQKRGFELRFTIVGPRTTEEYVQLFTLHLWMQLSPSVLDHDEFIEQIDSLKWPSHIRIDDTHYYLP
uniref:Uncharacterized protein n=1 Tax=Panagrellus redivivus TaxID=6233 RepID=A0A7E4VDC9_PANRE